MTIILSDGLPIDDGNQTIEVVEDVTSFDTNGEPLIPISLQMLMLNQQ